MLNSNLYLRGFLAATLLSTLVYPAVAAEKQTSSDLAATITAEVDKRLKADGYGIADRCTDAEFVRRAYLDLTGVIPTAEQAKAFIDDKASDKRAKLIDALLASDNYGKHQADIWQGLIVTKNSDARRLDYQPLTDWLADHFNKNTAWDKLVTELLTATGPQDKNGAVTYFLANSSVDKMTDSVTKLFMGVQLQCAQCHNHPFTGWKQDEYWGMAQFFIKVQVGNINKANKEGTSPGIEEAKQIKFNKKTLPESAKMVSPKFLAGNEPKMATSDPYRPVFAEWLTSKKNPYFAKAMVNRTWAQFFGRGIVNPVDDMHKDNPASHAALLDALTAGFIADNYDLKNLIRTICNSEVYQRSCKPVEGKERAPVSVYSNMTVKVLTPEQLYDSLQLVIGKPTTVEKPAKGQAAKRPGGNARSAFVAFFQTEDNADPTEYQAGIPQALRLMNSPQFNTAALVANLAKANKKPEEAIEHLFLSTLSRRPTSTEMTRLLPLVQKGTPRDAYSDILWVLVNSSEFTLNH